ncbi:hypothetical protein L7F22_004450 [Adiantum nelumboides]|nr:hypothetical protein [Adiantum nelumboides]
MLSYATRAMSGYVQGGISFSYSYFYFPLLPHSLPALFTFMVFEILGLRQEYFMEDSERVTKRTFLESVACPKDGLSPMELLREFERRYAQLSTTEQVTLDAEKVELFQQVTGSEIQEKLELLLEGESIEQGLKTK